MSPPTSSLNYSLIIPTSFFVHIKSSVASVRQRKRGRIEERHHKYDKVIKCSIFSYFFSKIVRVLEVNFVAVDVHEKVKA